MKTVHAKFFKLLAILSYESKESVVYRYSGQTSLSWLYKNDRKTYDQMLKGMEKQASEREEMDKARKQVIASIAGYFKLTGEYQNLTYIERLWRIKATAEAAAGKKWRFNQIPLPRLRQISYEFTRKQKLYIEYQNLKALKDICLN